MGDTFVLLVSLRGDHVVTCGGRKLSTSISLDVGNVVTVVTLID